MPLESVLNVHRISRATDWASKFPEWFSDGLGTLCCVKVKIRVAEDAQLQSSLHRTAPFAFQDLEGQEIQTST